MVISTALLMRVLPYVAAAVLAFGGGWTVRSWKADSDALEATEATNEALAWAVNQAYVASADYEAYRASLTTAREQSRTIIERYYRDNPNEPVCVVPEPVADSLRQSIATANAAIASEPSTALPND